MIFTDLIFHHAQTRPNKPAIILADRVVTYGMMATGILSVADRIGALGLPPGALVAVTVAPPIRNLIVVAALFRLGHPVLPARHTRDIPPGLPIAAFLESEPEALVPGLPQTLVEDEWFSAAPRRFDAMPARGFADEDTICLVTLSSGTTGTPKISSSSVAGFNRNVLNYFYSIGQGHWDRMLCLFGLASYFGLSLAAHALQAGKTLSFVATAQDALNLIAVHNIDCLIGAPQHLQEMIDRQREAPVPCPSLRVILTGGSFVSQTLLTEARAALCSGIIVQYGATETGGNAFAPAERLMGIEGATGFVPPWCDMQIVDAENRILPPDSIGFLRIRSLSQNRPYPPGAPEAASGFRDGWFYPGDLARLTEDGMLIMAGRDSEIVSAGAARIAPELVEEIARRHPAIADAAALAGTNAAGAAEVWLAIVARAAVEPQELIEFCGAQGVPVQRVIPVDAIPRNPMGKIERERLKRSL